MRDGRGILGDDRQSIQVHGAELRPSDAPALPVPYTSGRSDLGARDHGNPGSVYRRTGLPGAAEFDRAVTLLVVLCGAVGLGILLVLLTHLITAMAALVPAGAGISLKLGGKK